jgi:allantoinase
MPPAAHFDRTLRGDLVLADRILRDGWVAVRGETIAAIGEGAPPRPSNTPAA